MFLLYRSRSYRVDAASPWSGSGIRWIAEPPSLPDGDGDRSAGICFPTDSGQIFPADLPALHLAGEKGGAEPVFCHQEKAGRVFIQTIDRPEHEGFLFLSEIVRQTVGQGIAVVSLGGVDGHSSWLVYHQEMCILI